MKCVFVTGGAGFMGSNLIRFLHRELPGTIIVNYDALTYAGNLENLRGLETSERYVFIKGDVCDGKKVAKVLEDWKPEVIFHLAAESHVDRSILDPSPFIRTNVEGTQVLLHAVLHTIPESRFVYVSTDEVYGDAEPGEFFTESSPIKPSSPYSASKAGGDLLTSAYVRTYGLNAVIVRPSNNYGPYQFPEKLIPLVITNALEDKPIPVYGDGLQERDWIFVEDACRGIYLAGIKGEKGKAYNIGYGEPRPNLEVIKTVLDILGKPHSLITHVKDRPGHDRRYAMKIDRAKKELGWTPQVDFRTGMERTVKWYLENKEWWMRVKSGEYREYYEKQYGDRLRESPSR